MNRKKWLHFYLKCSSVIGLIHRNVGDAEGRRLAAIFRLSVMALGAVVLIAVKLYQRRKVRR